MDYNLYRLIVAQYLHVDDRTLSLCYVTDCSSAERHSDTVSTGGILDWSREAGQSASLLLQ